MSKDSKKCYNCAILNGAGIACCTAHVHVIRKTVITLEPLKKRRDERITCACGCGVIGCDTEE